MGASGLGALLVKEGFLTEQDRVTITKTCGQGSWAFAKCILSTGLLDEDELSAFFAERTKYVVAPKNLLDRLDKAIVEQVDRRMVSRLEVLPLEIDHNRITVAVADPLDKSTLKQLEFFTGLEVVPVIAPLSQIYEGLSRLNPDFKARPTALSNFLRNHAGSAWVKQKIVEEGDVEIPLVQSRARAGAVDEDHIQDVSLDDEIDTMGAGNENLNDIEAGGLDEGIGNSDFDDIDLEDSDSDLELAPGDDPDDSLEAGESVDDAGMDKDDPFDSFDDAPSSKKAASTSGDDLEGLESGGDIGDDLWPDAEDAPDQPAAPVKARSAPADESDEEDDLNLSDDFGLDDEPAKAAAMDSDNDFGLDGEPAQTARDEAADDDLLGDTPDLNFDGEMANKAKSNASALDEDLNFGDEDSTDHHHATKKSVPQDDLNFDDDEPGEDIDDSFADPAPPSKAVGHDLPGFADKKPKAPAESTRMATRPVPQPVNDDDEDDLAGIEFADEDETSVSLRKAVHEDGVLPEFNDPNFDDADEVDTRIDLRPVPDELHFSEDATEETNIKLHPPTSKGKAAAELKPDREPADEMMDLKGDSEPAFDDDHAHKLEDLEMGFADDESIDDPAVEAMHDEPAIEDLNADRALDDIPIGTNGDPARAGGRTVKAFDENGSVASLTATAKANEALLRMSLCFDRSTALDIAREYLPQISDAGCLVDIGKTTETLATWRSGAQSAAKGKATATFQRLAKVARSGQWSEVPLSAQDDLFGAVQSISVYKIQKDDGRILLLAGDYPIEDDSLRDALTSFAEQLGTK